MSNIERNYITNTTAFGANITTTVTDLVPPFNLTIGANPGERQGNKVFVTRQTFFFNMTMSNNTLVHLVFYTQKNTAASTADAFTINSASDLAWGSLGGVNILKNIWLEKDSSFTKQTRKFKFDINETWLFSASTGTEPISCPRRVFCKIMGNHGTGDSWG